MTNYKKLDQPISTTIRTRIQEGGGTFFANHNISKFLEDGDIDLLVDEVAEKFEAVLRSLVIDVDNDHNTQNTARRVAKMYVKETFSGRYDAPPATTVFPNASKYDQVYVVGPVAIHSACSHHFQNIIGHAYVGISPGALVCGLSKVHREILHESRRPQIQEEMTSGIADRLMAMTQADGIAVQVDAEHHCVACRGVRDNSSMVTSVVRGTFRDNASMKQEFMSIVSDMKRSHNK